jgi:hypothetical protein
MNEVILIGTSHSIQEGKINKEEFENYLIRLCEEYSIKSIAEETRHDCETIGKAIATQLSIAHIIIEPRLEEYESLGIENLNIIQKELFSRSDMHPVPNNIKDLPLSLKVEYHERLQKHMRDREKIWLEKIEDHNVYPLLITCGADHFDCFSNLLQENNISVNSESSKWGI